MFTGTTIDTGKITEMEKFTILHNERQFILKCVDLGVISKHEAYGLLFIKG